MFLYERVQPQNLQQNCDSSMTDNVTTSVARSDKPNLIEGIVPIQRLHKNRRKSKHARTSCDDGNKIIYIDLAEQVVTVDEEVESCQRVAPSVRVPSNMRGTKHVEIVDSEKVNEETVSNTRVQEMDNNNARLQVVSDTRETKHVKKEASESAYVQESSNVKETKHVEITESEKVSLQLVSNARETHVLKVDGEEFNAQVDSNSEDIKHIQLGASEVTNLQVSPTIKEAVQILKVDSEKAILRVPSTEITHYMKVDNNIVNLPLPPNIKETRQILNVSCEELNHHVPSYSLQNQHILKVNSGNINMQVHSHLKDTKITSEISKGVSEETNLQMPSNIQDIKPIWSECRDKTNMQAHSNTKVTNHVEKGDNSQANMTLLFNTRDTKHVWEVAREMGDLEQHSNKRETKEVWRKQGENIVEEMLEKDALNERVNSTSPELIEKHGLNRRVYTNKRKAQDIDDGASVEGIADRHGRCQRVYTNTSRLNRLLNKEVHNVYDISQDINFIKEEVTGTDLVTTQAENLLGCCSFVITNNRIESGIQCEESSNTEGSDPYRQVRPDRRKSKHVIREDMPDEINRGNPEKVEENPKSTTKIKLSTTQESVAKGSDMAKETTSKCRKKIDMEIQNEESSSQATVKCKICNKSFLKVTLVDHLLYHKNKHAFNCNKCPYRQVRPDRRKSKHVIREEMPDEINQDNPEKVEENPKSTTKFKCRKKIDMEIQNKQSSSQAMVKCKICNKSFLKVTLVDHLLYHKNKHAFKCNKCNCEFNSDLRLKYHMLRHKESHFRPFGGDTMLSCSICKKKFQKKLNFQLHMKLHEENVLECCICGKTFKTCKSLNKHKMSHRADRPHKCPTCNRSYKSPSSLSGHLKCCDKKRTLSCQICKITFETYRTLSKHLASHSATHASVCSKCGCRCKSQRLLKHHAKCCPGKSKNCHVCGKHFSRMSAFKSHFELAHSGDKCGSVLNNTSNCMLHKKQQEVQKQFKCNECSASFPQLRRLVCHKLVHSRELVCVVCKKAFKTQQNLQKHVLKHAGVQLFTCSLCQRLFRYKHVLVNHLKTQHCL